jgi:hypothetical protein
MRLVRIYALLETDIYQTEMIVPFLRDGAGLRETAIPARSRAVASRLQVSRSSQGKACGLPVA